MKRANYIGAPGFYNLNLACHPLAEAFGYNLYLVGSSLQKRDYRDVDIRCILDDGEYARLFQGLSGNPQTSALWSIMCCSISEWLSSRTGLPIDFQIQMQTEANREFGTMDHPRHAIGIFINRKIESDK